MACSTSRLWLLLFALVAANCVLSLAAGQQDIENDGDSSVADSEEESGEFDLSGGGNLGAGVADLLEQDPSIIRRKREARPSADFLMARMRRHAGKSFSVLVWPYGYIPICPYPHGLFPFPSDCSRFLNCAHGKANVQYCPSGLHFNRNTRQCDWPYNARCW